MGVVAASVAAIFLFKFVLFSGKPENSIQIEPLTPNGKKAAVVENHPDPASPQASNPASARLVTQTQYSPQTQALVQTLTEILNSKNDNDPRLDSNFRNLTVEAKAALRAKYAELPKEDRNGRGTIALLIGREIRDASDVAFLKEIISEAPCLSLSDCGREMHTATGGDTHLDSGVEVTLAYPQMSSLYWLEKFLTGTKPGDMPAGLQEEARKAIEAAKTSPIGPVRRRALDLDKRLLKSP